MSNTEIALYSQEAEEALLGTVLVAPEVFPTIDIKTDEFFIHRHRFIWQAFERLYNAGTSIDFVTITNELERMGKLGEVGGAARLSGYAATFASIRYADDYVKIIRDYSRRRQWMTLANNIAKLALDKNNNLDQEAPAVLDALVNSSTQTGSAVHISEFSTDVLAETLERSESPRDVWGIPTGILDFDDITGGLQCGEVLQITGEPGVGKSMLADQIGFQMAITDHPGAIYSLEMKGTSVIRRRLSQLSRVSTRAMKSGRVTEDDIEAISFQVQNINKLPLYMSDSAGWSTVSLRADLARLKAIHKIEWFVLDYAYLLSDGQGQSENDRTGFISAQLKGICRGLDLAGIVILSLNKAGMGGGLPGGRDLRGSGQQFYDTDILLLMVKDGQNENLINCIIGKGRELENPKQHFSLLKRAGIPGFENVKTETVKLGSWK